jgi:hydrogenase nickel incorporation protein HypA/HybF
MAERILKAVLDVADSKRAKSVVEINLDIGELTFLSPEQLIFCMQVVSKGTIAENAKIEIATVRAQVHCPKCGYAGDVSYLGEEVHTMIPIPILTCPKCGSTEAHVTSGNECAVRSIRVRVEDEEA